MRFQPKLRATLDTATHGERQGEHADGHQFIDAAVDAGCVALVVEREIETAVPYVIVQDARKALYDLAMQQRMGLPAFHVIAVTGSVGKTTTKDLIACMPGDCAVASEKSFNNDLGVPLTILAGDSAKFLIADWASSKEDYDQTVMRLEFDGVKDGKTVFENYKLLDYYDKENDISSMARTTGYTCTAVADILLSNKFTKKGVYNLESLGSDKKIVDSILHYLSQRNIKFDKEVK